MRNYQGIREWLESFIPNVYGKEELGLARIEELLRRLGNPEEKFKSVHVAGTSGKGSTAFYIARLLQFSGPAAALRALAGRPVSSFPARNATHSVAGGLPASAATRKLRIGLHVSPHLTYVGERMQINDKPIPVKKLIELIELIKITVEQIQREKPELTPSYFEILVAASFLYFAQEKVDFAVVEVGLGGRLDATNVLMPEVSVITNVGLDHTDILGSTVEKIAHEKAGIVKRGVPVITGATGEALEVIKKVAKKNNAPLVSVSGIQYSVSGIPKYATKETMTLAVKTVETLGFKITKQQMEKAFSVGFPGRFEEIQPGVILDGAHNPDKIRALIDFVKKSKIHNPKSIILVLAFKKGKDWKTMVDLLVKNLPVKEIIVTEFNAVTDTGRFAAVPAEEIAEYIITNDKYQMTNTQYYKNSQEAVFNALLNTIYKIPNTLVLVTGSLYLVGEVREMWKSSDF